jgi:hypothetical protein
MTAFEAVFDQKDNDGICVGSQKTDEFIDEEKVEYMLRTDNGTDSQTDTETDSQTETETDSKTVYLL